MKTVICTTGTSVAGGIRFDQSIDTEEASKKYRREINHLLQSLPAEDPKTYMTRASAESNSLFRMGLDRNDCVFLLHSDTPDGKTCAEAVKNLIKRKRGPKDVRISKIAGLQVADGHRFRRKGINSLFEELDRIYRLHQPEIWLNVTGGYKSVVPYVTLFGQLYQLPVVYIFERSDSLITLPPAPVNFDFERLARAADAIHDLNTEGTIRNEDRFFNLIDPRPDYLERDWFATLLEREGDEVTLSAFGQLALQVIQEDAATTVNLSRNAQRAYRAAAGTPKEQFNAMLGRVRNPWWRTHKDHAFRGTDLKVAKPGSTAQRMAYYMEENEVYVCELYANHEAYTQGLPRRMQADYAAEQWTVHHP